MKFTKATKEMFVVCLIFLLAACEGELPPRPTPIAIAPDNSLLTKQPCSPPCWHGLIPGQTNLADVDAFLKTSSLVHQNMVEKFIAPNGKEFSYDWWWAGDPHDYNRHNTFEIDKNNILKQFFIEPNVDITPVQIIGIYGLPTLISLAVYGPHADKVHFSALYEDLQLEVQWYEDRDPAKNDYFCPTLNRPLIEIDYYSRELSESNIQDLRDSMNVNPVGGGAGGAIVEGSSVIKNVDGKIQIDCIKIR